MGHDAAQLLRAAEGNAEAGDHLIEHQQRAVALADFQRALQVSGPRDDAVRVAHYRFHDDAGDLVAMGIEYRLQGVQVVPLRNDDVISGARRHARRLSDGRGVIVRTGLVQRRVDAVKHRVCPAMVVAFELDPLVSAGERPGEAQHQLIDLRSRGGVSDQTVQRYCLPDQLGYRQLPLELAGEAKAILNVARYGIQDEVRRVPEQVRAHAHHVVDVFVAVDVPEFGAFPPLEKQGNGRFRPPDLAAHAAGDHRVGALEEFFASLEAQLRAPWGSFETCGGQRM